MSWPDAFSPADGPRLRGSLEPKNLVGALLLQFAASIDSLEELSQMPPVRSPFEVSREPGTGTRIDARFCSARCRVSNYRGRIEQPQRMRAAGRSHAEIARELKSQGSTVEGWLVETGGVAYAVATHERLLPPGKFPVNWL
jgi:hypothetical protein